MNPAFLLLKNLANVMSQHVELVFWLTSIVLIYLMPADGNHYSLCVPGMLGFDRCLGCGIGHSIHHYLHLNFKEGWEHHYMGAFAIPVIFYRIFILFQLTFSNKQTNHAKQNI